MVRHLPSGRTLSLVHGPKTPHYPREHQRWSGHTESNPPTCSLRPVILNNARPLRITAAAGTELAGTFT